jgi:hypothetical protein
MNDNSFFRYIGLVFGILRVLLVGTKFWLDMTYSVYVVGWSAVIAEHGQHYIFICWEIGFHLISLKRLEAENILNPLETNKVVRDNKKLTNHNNPSHYFIVLVVIPI